MSEPVAPCHACCGQPAERGRLARDVPACIVASPRLLRALPSSGDLQVADLLGLRQRLEAGRQRERGTDFPACSLSLAGSHLSNSTQLRAVTSMSPNRCSHKNALELPPQPRLRVIRHAQLLTRTSHRDVEQPPRVLVLATLQLMSGEQ